MSKTKKYNFSLTAASLRLPEMLKTAQAIYDKTDFNYTDELGRGNEKTGKRMYFEMQKRIEILTPSQLELFIHGDLITQKQIAFLSICKCFTFIRDFAIEVLREKVLMYDYEIRKGEYLSFFRRKNELHEEMDDLSEQSQYKIKQVIFKILEQAGIIDNIKDKNIQPQLLDTKVNEAIAEDHPNWLKVFFMSDLDIQQNS
jgi:hypothetical protein